MSWSNLVMCIFSSEFNVQWRISSCAPFSNSRISWWNSNFYLHFALRMLQGRNQPWGKHESDGRWICWSSRITSAQRHESTVPVHERERAIEFWDQLGKNWKELCQTLGPHLFDLSVANIFSNKSTNCPSSLTSSSFIFLVDEVDIKRRERSLEAFEGRASNVTKFCSIRNRQEWVTPFHQWFRVNSTGCEGLEL